MTLLTLLDAVGAEAGRLAWTFAFLMSALIVGTYAWRFNRRVAADARRFEESVDAPQAMGQFPYIDPALCIGCGSCVDVCPEGDVLGLVGGQAIVINGARCIGIAACEAACPVGAIEVGMGDIRGRADLPVLTEELETSVPGLFIAGELGGLSLVRNAVNQGAGSVREVSRQLRAHPLPISSDSESRRHDLVIIGSGPTGISAALTAHELSLDYLVLEQEPDLGGTIFNYPRRKIVHSQPVELPLHGWLRKAETSKEELLELFEDLHRRHKLNLHFGERVIAMAYTEDGIAIQSTSGTTRARFVIVAIGRRGTPRKLGVPGEELSKVSYQVRDAELFQDQRVLCVGGGDSAVEAAMGLAAQRGNQVTLSYRRSAFGRIKCKNLERLDLCCKRGQIDVVFESNVQEIRPDSVLLQERSESRWIDNDAVFIFAGGVPPFPLLKSAGVRFADELLVGTAASDESVGEH